MSRLGLVSDRIPNVSVSKTCVSGLVLVSVQKVSCTSLLTVYIAATVAWWGARRLDRQNRPSSSPVETSWSTSALERDRGSREEQPKQLAVMLRD